MKKFFFDCGTRDKTASLGILVLRVLTGFMMLAGHGWAKLSKFSTLKDEFAAPAPFDALPPVVNLVLLIGAEFVAAAMIIIGLATRPAAFVLGFAMVVAAFAYHANDPLFLGQGAAKEPALLYVIPMLAIIITGAGAYSADAAIYKDSKRRRW